MGRIKYATKNIAFGYMSNIITSLLGFVLRKVFILRLSDTLLGVNGLYTGILSILSLAELGIGTALNYSLYAPMAEGDIEKMKSYMRLYRKAYRMIAVIVAVIGLCAAPFLPDIIKNPGSNSVQDLTNYYLIFLFNTVSTYLVSYKYSLAYAEQKNYIQTNVITITKVVTVVLQIVVILLTSNFYLYLFTAAGVELVQKIFVNHYLNKKYPYLLDREVKPLEEQEKQDIVKKTKALVCHKVGDVARLQTDAIIISAFIDVVLVGIVDNYNMVISSISNFVNIIFNSVLSSFGNLIATENKEKQYGMFKVYRFSACWIYGYSAVGFYVLLSPLVRLWLGEQWLLGNLFVACILIDYYFKGDRIVLTNFKTAAGVFEQDKYLALIQGAVNLIISLALVKSLGLVGVYLGTIISGLIANITKPFIIYRVCFDKGAAAYFADSAKFLFIIILSLVLILPVSAMLISQVTIIRFLVTGVVVTVIFNGLLVLAFRNTEEFRYLWSLFGEKIMRKIGKKG